MDGLAMQDRGQLVFGTGIAFVTVSFLACMARGWVRIKLTKRMWSDDWLLFTSMITFSVLVVLLVSSTCYGMGKHVEDPRIRDYKMSLQIWFYSDLLYTLCSATLRVAAGEHLMRHISRKWQRVLVIGLTWTNIIYNLYMIFALIFRCSPVHAYWDNISWFTGEYELVCELSIARTSKYVQMTLGAITDTIYALLPLSILRDVTLSRAQRLAIVGVSTLALLSGVSAVIRIPFIEQMRPARDWTWIAIDIAIWEMVELTVGILSLCLATFTPIMVYFWPMSASRQCHRPSNGPFYRGEYDSGPNLQGIALGKGYGNISYIEGGQGKNKSTRTGKSGNKSAESLTGFSRDMVIVKTTDVSTSSSENTSPISLPSAYFRR